MTNELTYFECIKKVCKEEIDNKLYEIVISEIPVWRVVYRRFRDNYILLHTSVPPLNNHPQFNFKSILLSSIFSLYQITKILIKGKKYRNIVLGFPRLEIINGKYIDKFCDPVIKRTSLKDSYLYFERGRSGIHRSPREIDNIVWVEAIDNLSLIMGYIIAPFVYLLNHNAFKELYNRSNKIFELSRKDKFFIVYQFSHTLIKRKIYKIIFKRLNVKNVLSVTLMNRPWLLSACLQNNIRCMEIQHGFTENENVMYSGQYIETFSPDYFLAFGETSINPYFNVPVDKIINIGFAFKEYITEVKNKGQRGFLFISDPEITPKIIKTICQLKEAYPAYDFWIRFHPMEKPSIHQIKLLTDSGIKIDDNTINSNLAILNYNGIIGENSSVLYESICFGIKTAKLHLNTLNEGVDMKRESENGFYIINQITDFDNFINRTDSICLKKYYSTFSPSSLNNILK